MCSLSDRCASLSVYFSRCLASPDSCSSAAPLPPLLFPLSLSLLAHLHWPLNIAKYFSVSKVAKIMEKYRVKIIFVCVRVCVGGRCICAYKWAWQHRHLPLYNFECFYTAKLLAYFNETTTWRLPTAATCPKAGQGAEQVGGQLLRRITRWSRAADWQAVRRGTQHITHIN